VSRKVSADHRAGQHYIFRSTTESYENCLKGL
jgi:hypothetical protein